MGKKKSNQQDKTNTASTKEEPQSIVESASEIPAADPVSQLKMSLAALSKHVEAMGNVLGVPTRQKSPLPQSTDTPGPSANQSNVFERPDMSQEEKQAQRKAKAAEKKARAEAAKAKKDAEISGDGQTLSPPTDNAERPEMSQEEKQAQRKAKAAEKKARAEAAIAKKNAGISGEGQNLAIAADNAERPEMSQEEKQAQRKAKAAEKKARAEAAIAKKNATDTAEPTESGKELPNGFTKPQQNSRENISPPKSALKKPKEFEEDRKVNFDFYREDTEDDIPTPVEEVYIPPPSFVHNPDIHYSFYNLYVKCEKELIYEIDDLCIEFILAFRAFFRDLLGITIEEELEAKPGKPLETGEKGSFGAEVNKTLSLQIAFLNTDGQFPLPAALGNIVKQLKREISKMDTRSDAHNVINWVHKISHLYFDGSYDEMASHLKVKLKKAKHLVLYNCNRVMEKVLSRCKDQDLTCSVIDDKSYGRGYKFASWLAENGFKTQYSVLDGAAHIMQSGSLTIMGCSSILSNGNLSGAKGTSQLCMLSQFYNLPTVCLAQSFKFVDKATVPHKRIALLYRDHDEVITSDLITAVVTDIRILPPSSAPAVLKVKALDSLSNIS